MRVMMDAIPGEVAEVIEVSSFKSDIKYGKTKKDKSVPVLFKVVAGRGSAEVDNAGVCLGEYDLDGTKETYEKALKNFTKIAEALLSKGYCRLSDFENFTVLF